MKRERTSPYGWRVISDPHLTSAHFVISPRTGDLIELSEPTQVFESWAMRAIYGFTENTFCPSFSDKVCDPIDPPEINSIESKFDRRDITSAPLRCFIRLAIRLLPLSFLVRFGTALIPLNGKPADLPQALHRVACAFGRRSAGNCLELAICRFFLFRMFGWRTTIHIGVLYPTEEMHAWVALNGVPVLEDADVVAHYQTAVFYSDTSSG